jgi:tetratricopeptide (TPR) repeat protein
LLQSWFTPWDIIRDRITAAQHRCNYKYPIFRGEEKPLLFAAEETLSPFGRLILIFSILDTIQEGKMTTRNTYFIAASFICASIILSACAKQSGGLDNTLSESKDYIAAMSFYNQNKVDSAAVYFGKLTISHPNDPEAWTWYAESKRRLGNMDEAARAANSSLDIDPQYAFAHTVLGDLYNPQYSMWDKADADIAWDHLMKAVDWDYGEGNAWLSVWIEAMHRKNNELENNALTSLYESEFFTEVVLEQNRWALTNLPENALYITNGDLDTYPALILQKNEQLRPDVSVVNFSLLNLPWYVELISERNHLAPPMSTEKMESYQPSRNENGKPVLLAHKVLQYWLDQQSKLSRPIVAAVTCSDDVLELFKPRTTLMGSGYIQAKTEAEKIHPESVRTAIDGLNGKLFAGATYSAQDKSAVRRAAEQGFSAKVPFYTGVSLVQHFIDNNESTEAREYITLLRKFATDAGMAKEDLKTLDELGKKIM